MSRHGQDPPYTSSPPPGLSLPLLSPTASRIPRAQRRVLPRSTPTTSGQSATIGDTPLGHPRELIPSSPPVADYIPYRQPMGSPDTTEARGFGRPNWRSSSYNNNNPSMASTRNSPPTPQTTQSSIPPNAYAEAAAVGTPTPANNTTPPSSLDGSDNAPQVQLTAREASFLVCPWWAAFDRCGTRGCNFSHGRGPGLLEEDLICPYWARSPATSGAGCNKVHGSCKFAHHHCRHGQWAPVPKPPQ